MKINKVLLKYLSLIVIGFLMLPIILILPVHIITGNNFSNIVESIIKISTIIPLLIDIYFILYMSNKICNELGIK